MRLARLVRKVRGSRSRACPEDAECLIWRVSLLCSEMAEYETVSGTFVFRGVDYLVSVVVSQSVEDPEQEVLLVDVEEKSTAEQWRGEFQPSCMKFRAMHEILGLH